MSDTIAAIASGITVSGIGVIRVSGPESIRIVDHIFIPKKNGRVLYSKGYTLHYGHLSYLEERLDEVCVLVFKAPHSFTGEDVVEIDSHGGIFVMRKIMSVLLKLGVRVADPGEFTKRAFLNGRMDLSQAESVIGVINSTNDEALTASLSQLSGNLSKRIRDIRDMILCEAAFIEAALDDPEHYDIDSYHDELLTKSIGIRVKISELLDTYSYGRTINDGVKVAIIGSPNVGKSSLLNTLTGTDRAIVTDIAGTTRDTLSESINLKGMSINLTDTAGIRESGDEIERIGVKRAREAADNSDLILFVIDLSRELSDDENHIIELLSEKIVKGRVIAVLNKCDKKRNCETGYIKRIFGNMYVEISAKYDRGIDNLFSMIYSIFSSGKVRINDEVVITSLRHYNNLLHACDMMEDAINSIENYVPEDFISSDLMLAYEYLGFIIGESVGEDVIEKIFKDFCMGK